MGTVCLQFSILATTHLNVRPMAVMLRLLVMFASILNHCNHILEYVANDSNAMAVMFAPILNHYNIYLSV